MCELVTTQTRIHNERSRNIVKVALTIYLYTTYSYYITLLYQYREYYYIFPTVDAWRTITRMKIKLISPDLVYWEIRKVQWDIYRILILMYIINLNVFNNVFTSQFYLFIYYLLCESVKNNKILKNVFFALVCFKVLKEYFSF